MLREISCPELMQVGYMAIEANYSEQNIHLECLPDFGYFFLCQ